MPIKECNEEGKSGFKWGDAGKCYIHDGTSKSKKIAKKKALIQGVASGEIFKERNEKDC